MAHPSIPDASYIIVEEYGNEVVNVFYFETLDDAETFSVGLCDNLSSYFIAKIVKESNVQS